MTTLVSNSAAASGIQSTSATQQMASATMDARYFDGTIIVQKALSTLLRTNQRIRLITAVDILRGFASEQVMQCGYGSLSTYGIGRDISRSDWRDYLLQMLHLGYFRIDYRDDHHLKVTNLGLDVLYGRASAVLEMPQPEGLSGQAKRHERQQQVRNVITIAGVAYVVPLDLWRLLPWRDKVREVKERQYWNFYSDVRLPLTDLVPAAVERRDEVVAKFAEIVEAAYGVRIEGEELFIPQRVEYDEAGAPVVGLQCADFDDALTQFRAFVEQNQRYPMVGGPAYECSLRRWYQEVAHQLVQVSDAQRQAFKEMDERYQGVPKTRRAVKA